MYIIIMIQNLNKPTEMASLTGELDRWVGIKTLPAVLGGPSICTVLVLQTTVIVCAVCTKLLFLMTNKS